MFRPVPLHHSKFARCTHPCPICWILALAWSSLKDDGVENDSQEFVSPSELLRNAHIETMVIELYPVAMNSSRAKAASNSGLLDEVGCGLMTTPSPDSRVPLLAAQIQPNQSSAISYSHWPVGSIGRRKESVESVPSRSRLIRLADSTLVAFCLRLGSRNMLPVIQKASLRF